MRDNRGTKLTMGIFGFCFLLVIVGYRVRILAKDQRKRRDDLNKEFATGRIGGTLKNYPEDFKSSIYVMEAPWKCFSGEVSFLSVRIQLKNYNCQRPRSYSQRMKRTLPGHCADIYWWEFDRIFLLVGVRLLSLCKETNASRWSWIVFKIFNSKSGSGKKR